MKDQQFFGSLCDKLIRTSIVKANGIYPYERINYTEDFNVTFRVLCYAYRVVGLDAPLYHYDVSRADSACRSGYVRNLTEHQVPCLRRLEDFVERRYQETGEPLFRDNRLFDSQKFWSKWGLFVNHEFDLWSRTWPECHRHIMACGSIDWKFRVFLRLFCNHPKILKLIYRLKR